MEKPGKPIIFYIGTSKARLTTKTQSWGKAHKNLCVLMKKLRALCGLEKLLLL